MRKLEILFDNSAAWTGVYAYLDERQVARVTFDPTFPSGPRLTVAAGARCRRFALPHITWALAAKGGLMLRLYKQQQRFLHWADNRYRK